MITVLFFGPVAERVGVGRLELAYRPGLLLAALREELALRYPDAFALVSLVAVDGEQVRDMGRVLAEGAEVVFMSKFSGG